MDKRRWQTVEELEANLIVENYFEERDGRTEDPAFKLTGKPDHFRMLEILQGNEKEFLAYRDAAKAMIIAKAGLLPGYVPDQFKIKTKDVSEHAIMQEMLTAADRKIELSPTYKERFSAEDQRDALVQKIKKILFAEEMRDKRFRELIHAYGNPDMSGNGDHLKRIPYELTIAAADLSAERMATTELDKKARIKQAGIDFNAVKDFAAGMPPANNNPKGATGIPEQGFVPKDAGGNGSASVEKSRN